ncbi:MAG: NADH-dependent [FeFe] hydrogenase, group A6 [Spirochaetia bacterium]|jgi:NADH-quinone oxidoreductase subunit G/NADP-reducing hydrogenase subunit HndD
MTNLTINNRKIQAKPGLSILEAAQAAGEKIPTLCHIKEVFPSGACRMCVVEVKGKPNLTPSCAFPAEEGMEIQTRSPRVITARRTIIELLLASHPFDCLTCPKNGFCELQSLASEYGIDRVPFQGKTRHHYTDFSSPSIIREPDKCILCGRCVRICEEIQGVAAIDFTRRGFDTMVLPPFENDLSETTCVNCGQCTLACPTGALHEVRAVEKVMMTMQEGKKYIVAQVAPAIRVSLGDFFGLPAGTNVTGKAAAALRRMGFRQVFDTDFAADLTIMEEGTELVNKISKGERLPMFTSCCPAWVKYAEHYYPELLPRISSCKSPQEMMGATIKSYLAQKQNIDPKDIFVVSVMPCTAKKFEASRPELSSSRGVADVDAVLTTRQFNRMLQIYGIEFASLPDEDYDRPFGAPTGSGDIFAASGGVMESALRTAYHLLTGKDLATLEFEDARGMAGVKEARVLVGDRTLRIAIANRLSNARVIAERVMAGDAPWDFIEIMACPGGCAGGGGQMFGYDPERIEQRIKSIYALDKARTVRLSYKNPAITEVYRQFFGKPGSDKAHQLLHTAYASRSASK